MKPDIIGVALSFTLFLCSCTTAEEKKFVGTWGNKEKNVTLRIKKDGANFMVQTMAGGHVEEAKLFKLEGNCLLSRAQKNNIENPAVNICFQENTGHLEWDGVEWERN